MTVKSVTLNGERWLMIALALIMAMSCVHFLVASEMETTRLNEFQQRNSLAIDVVRQP
jgi:hypothetical protein